jgi:8-oxo-dGTP diphosphatase
MPRPNDVGVGTALLVFKVIRGVKHLLLGKRKGAHAAGCWSFPGGWMDRADDASAKACARELLEEAGLVADPCYIHPVAWTTEDHPELNARTVTLYHECYVFDGEPKVMEPNKCEEWRWFPVDQLPHPLFPGIEGIMDQYYGQ